jgi:hypothetical protein
MVITSNYNTLANQCTRILTTAHTKSSQFVFISRFLVTDSNSILCSRPYRMVKASQLIPRTSHINLLLL